jgi:hypothetical protein
MRMIADIHNFQLPFLCQLSKSAPNVLWTVRGFLSENPLQVARSNPAVIVAKVSFPEGNFLMAAFCGSAAGEGGHAPFTASKKYCPRRPYVGATNWPWSQSIVALDCMGSPSFTAVLS